MILKISRIVGLIALFIGCSQVIAAEYEFKLHHFLSPKSPAHAKMLAPWA